MIITHAVDGKKISKRIDERSAEAENIGFLLSNNHGNYFLSMKKKSRYSGYFFFCGEMFRILDEIVRADSQKKSEKESGRRKSEEIINEFYAVTRVNSDGTEYFLMPKKFNSLIYALNVRKRFFLDFDIRKAYDSRRFGMYYTILRAENKLKNGNERNKILIKFEKRSDCREDDSDAQKEFELWIAVRCSGTIKEISQWVEKNYDFDRERGSPPYTRFVFRAIELNASCTVITVAENRVQAERECDFVYDNAEQFRKNEKMEFKRQIEKRKIRAEVKPKLESPYLYFAKIGAMSSIDALAHADGIIAGLPWFFQKWVRDEMMCLKYFILEKKYSYVKSILFERLNKINERGTLDVLTGRASADSAGLLFMRFDDFLNAVKREGLLERYVKEEELDYLKKTLSRCIEHLTKEAGTSMLIQSGAGESWMDSIERKGACIEIQALFLRMLKLMHRLSSDKRYKETGLRFRKNTRAKFWNKRFLKDSENDETVRPNIFLACYFYPELLTKEEWKQCLDFALKRLYNSWGGLSTIDKHHAKFIGRHTGENPESYHNGDSWFFVNNISAIVMNRIDKKRFRKYIQQIIRADIEEILFKGVIGTAAELSSSSMLRSEGCLMQAWSNATFLELMSEIEKDEIEKDVEKKILLS